MSNAFSGEPGEVPDNEVNAHLGNPGSGILGRMRQVMPSLSFLTEYVMLVERIHFLRNFNGGLHHVFRQHIPMAKS